MIILLGLLATFTDIVIEIVVLIGLYDLTGSVWLTVLMFTLLSCLTHVLQLRQNIDCGSKMLWQSGRGVSRFVEIMRFEAETIETRFLLWLSYAVVIEVLLHIM